MSLTREEANQVASSDIQAKERECDSLKIQVTTLTQKLASSDERLQREKTKVKEVIQAQRDVRKSINASSGKRDPDFSSPGAPDQSSAQKPRRAGMTQSTSGLNQETMASDAFQ